VSLGTISILSRVEEEGHRYLGCSTVWEVWFLPLYSHHWAALGKVLDITPARIWILVDS